ncbi:MAG TPA: L,D-transpeptidase [Anaerolineales bacterium]|nr:L,D-transpeptidase [Anaerolineales bacterium]
MSKSFSRRDVLKLGGLSLGSLAFTRFAPSIFPSGFINFDDADLVRVATTSVSVYSTPSLDLKKSTITGTWYKDDLVHVYEEVTSDDPDLKLNPIWYRVWGGYMWRARLQPVKTLLNLPMTTIPEGMRLLAEVTVPFTQPWRFSKAFGWQSLNFRLYYESVYWIEEIVDGPDSQPWYRIFDDLTGNYSYATAAHLRPILPDTLNYISPNVPPENKRIDVNLTPPQTLTAYENEMVVLRTNISSGLATGNHTTTPQGEFHIEDKYPSKHMGNGNLASGPEDYELPGVPWTSFFQGDAYAFHGTYWHDNFGTPMSHGCVNMRTADAKWLFFWANPQTKNWSSYLPQSDKIDDIGYGTVVDIHF